jgi:uncharacterized protein YeaO (DUF488 family)
MILIKRAYDEAEKSDGLRILVDKLWPRGIKKEDLVINEWAKNISPSDGLRRWFGHKSERWLEFCKRYFKELDQKQEYWEPIVKEAKRKRVTLIFGAKDTEHNNAKALKTYLELKK